MGQMGFRLFQAMTKKDAISRIAKAGKVIEKVQREMKEWETKEQETFTHFHKIAGFLTEAQVAMSLAIGRLEDYEARHWK